MEQSGLLQDTTEKTFILYWGTLTKDFYINIYLTFNMSLSLMW